MRLLPPAPTASHPRVIVGIATTGRPAILGDTLRHLAALTDGPDAVLVCVADSGDIGQDVPRALSLGILTAPRGLCHQRNALLDAVDDNTILLFLDDDFLIGEGYVGALRRTFAEEPGLAMTTGRVLADGILGPGLDHDTGVARLGDAGPDTPPLRTETYNGYGCNMAVRAATVRAASLRFDTNLPRYGWLEDVDFSRRLAAHGRILHCGDMTGVHLGTKTGRSRGVPLGYSQIANPIYMIRKGTLAPRRGLRLMLRNVAANTARMLRPEPWVDRRGRFQGNLLALRDLMTGRLFPTRIEDL